jgi:hypothetical protein
VGDGERARELLPTLLLTLLSVVQALALEATWSSAREMPFLYAGGAAAWVGWLQVVAIFQGIVLIWLMYIAMVMRFSWVPSTWDSIAPFVLGAGELALVQLAELQQVTAWFLVMAAMFGFSMWISNRMFRSGIEDPQNVREADGAPRFAQGEQWVTPAFASLLVVMAGLVSWQGPAGAVAIGCLVVANALLLAQSTLVQRYWRLWLTGTRD